MKMSTAVLTLLFLAGSAGAYTPSFDSAEIRKTGHEINVRYGPGKNIGPSFPSFRRNMRSVFKFLYAEEPWKSIPVNCSESQVGEPF